MILADTIESAQSDVSKRKAEQAIEWENLQQTIRVTKSEADKARLDSSVAEIRTDIERQLLKLSQDEAEARYKQAQADLDFKKAAHAAEIRILELTLLRHTRHRDRHVKDVKAFKIYAPMDGLVVMSPDLARQRNGSSAAGRPHFPWPGLHEGRQHEEHASGRHGQPGRKQRVPCRPACRDQI